MKIAIDRETTTEHEEHELIQWLKKEYKVTKLKFIEIKKRNEPEKENDTTAHLIWYQLEPLD